MTSIGPYSQSYNFTHMYDIPDRRGKLPLKTTLNNSLLDIINSHPDFTIFNYMVKLGKMEGILNSDQANFTIFIPSDKYLTRQYPQSLFVNMDLATARHIIKSSMINRRISSEILKDSPSSFFYTFDDDYASNRLYVINISGVTYLDNGMPHTKSKYPYDKQIQVIQMDIEAVNGIIHVIDGLVCPTIL